MRLYRKRRWEGTQYVRIPLRATEVQDLISMGHLDEDQRHNEEAIRAAVLGLLHRAMGRCGMVGCTVLSIDRRNL